MIPIILPIIFSNAVGSSPSFYGYIGPSCAVVHDILFLHGAAIRQLSESEITEFRSYQEQNSRWNDAEWMDESESAPLLPDFCKGLDDSTEVVLKGCIIRNEHVYVDGQVKRPLDSRERQRIRMLIAKRTRMYRGRMLHLHKRRNKRSLLPGTNTNMLSEMLDRLLRLNSSVTSRFMPLVKQAPIFSSFNPSFLPPVVNQEPLTNNPPLIVLQAVEPKVVEIEPTDSVKGNAVRRKQPSVYEATTTSIPTSTQKTAARSIYLPPLPNPVLSSPSPTPVSFRVIKDNGFKEDQEDDKQEDRPEQINCDLMKKIAEALAKENHLLAQLPSLVRSDLQLPGCSIFTTLTNTKTVEKPIDRQMENDQIDDNRNGYKQTVGNDATATDYANDIMAYRNQYNHLPDDICLRL